MYLVDEYNHVGVSLQLLHQGFQALLKLSAILGACHNACHIQRKNALSKQHWTAVVGLNHLGQSLYNGALTYTRLANQYGVVLLAATQNLYNTLYLALATHTGIQLTISSGLCQVGTKAVEYRCLRGGLLLGGVINLAHRNALVAIHLKLLFLLVGQSYAVAHVITYVCVLRRKQYGCSVVVCHIVHF